MSRRSVRELIHDSLTRAVGVCSVCRVTVYANDEKVRIRGQMFHRECAGFKGRRRSK